MQQHKGILGKASSGSTDAISFGSARAELVFAESVHMCQVLGKHKAVETAFQSGQGASRTPEIKP